MPNQQKKYTTCRHTAPLANFCLCFNLQTRKENELPKKKKWPKQFFNVHLNNLMQHSTFRKVCLSAWCLLHSAPVANFCLVSISKKGVFIRLVLETRMQCWQPRKWESAELHMLAVSWCFMCKCSVVNVGYLLLHCKVETQLWWEYWIGSEYSERCQAQ